MRFKKYYMTSHEYQKWSEYPHKTDSSFTKKLVCYLLFNSFYLCHDSCLCCSLFLISGFWGLIHVFFCLVFCVLFFHVLCLMSWFFHALMCPLSFSCVLPSGSLCLLSRSLLVCSSVLLPLIISPGFLPPLSSPVPRHVISVCVFSLCVSPPSLSGHWILSCVFCLLYSVLCL